MTELPCKNKTMKITSLLDEIFDVAIWAVNDVHKRNKEKGFSLVNKVIRLNGGISELTIILSKRTLKSLF